MNWKLIGQYYLFGLMLFVAAFFVWFGSKFLFMSGDAWTPTQLFIAGVVLILSGVFVVSSPSLGNAWLVGGVLILCGFFMFARSAGVIEHAWLAKAVGISSWVAAGLLVFITFPKKA